uniref:Uncharacterized protein n=1 Tax=Anguilla anguilla TaxID=7936 RepID=A0A0E9UF37_ANGAN
MQPYTRIVYTWP